MKDEKYTAEDAIDDAAEIAREIVVSPKNWWRSKTVILNALTLIAGVIAFTAGSQWVTDSSSILAAVVALQGAVNIALRFVTIEGIE